MEYLVNSVSIIIATHGRESALRDTLLSLCLVEIPSNFLVEVVIAENGIASNAEQIVTTLPKNSFQFRSLFLDPPGKSNALNAAIQLSTGSVLLFTDDDVRFPKDWIREMCHPLFQGDGEVVIGGCRLAPHLQRGWMTRYHRGFLASTEYLSDDTPSEFAGVNFACVRQVFSEGLLFDCELGGGGLGNCEDSLLARQLSESGRRFVSRTQLHLTHHPSESRLLYQSWLSAAVAIGKSGAYLSHHWYHKRITNARARLLYLSFKLRLRSWLSGSRTPESEGISAWELSYRIDIARYRHYLKERLRPRNYSLRGLRKL